MNIQWEKQTRVILLVILSILTLVFAFFFKEFIKYLSISALMAFILSPLKDKAQARFNLSNKAATGVVFFLFVLLLILLLVLLIPLMITTADELISEAIIFQDAIDAWSVNLQSHGIPFASSISNLDLNEFTTKIINPEAIIGTASFFTENIFVAFMIFFVMYYLILDHDSMFALILKTIPKIERPDFQKLITKLKEIWRTYLKGQLALSTIIGLVTLVICLIIGMPGTGILVAFSMVLTLIPSFGTASMSILAAATAEITGSNTLSISPLWFGVITLILMQGVHFFEVYWLRPRIMGKSMNLHPAVVIIAVIASLSLSGIFLVLIIIPLLSSLMLISKFVYARMVGISPWEKVLPDEPEEQQIFVK